MQFLAARPSACSIRRRRAVRRMPTCASNACARNGSRCATARSPRSTTIAASVTACARWSTGPGASRRAPAFDAAVARCGGGARGRDGARRCGRQRTPARDCADRGLRRHVRDPGRTRPGDGAGRRTRRPAARGGARAARRADDRRSAARGSTSGAPRKSSPRRSARASGRRSCRAGARSPRWRSATATRRSACGPATAGCTSAAAGRRSSSRSCARTRAHRRGGAPAADRAAVSERNDGHHPGRLAGLAADPRIVRPRRRARPHHGLGGELQRHELPRSGRTRAAALRLAAS